jgi:hypothetical protein
MKYNALVGDYTNVITKIHCAQNVKMLLKSLCNVVVILLLQQANDCCVEEN